MNRSKFSLSLALLLAAIPALAAPKAYHRAPVEPGFPPQAAAALKKYSLPSPTMSTAIPAKPRVVLETTKGPITLELNKAAAPLHVRSFVYLVRRGFYNGTQFHRFADLTGQGGNIIQGGDPLSKSASTRQFAGVGGPGYEVPLEISNLKHDKLTIAAARSSNPDSAGSQFYICQAPVHFLDGQYTVFGKVVAGQAAALKLRQGDSIKSARVIK
ncbi:putative peptidyl-prolyl cis-trans isomerase [Abditibacteriota bacterium]|nr:putative peptidyl-prolyl cis-trans isomerase [Abditibacteriota bacterium]